MKNKSEVRNRIEFFKKMGHGKNMNTDFVGNACKHVMMCAKFLMTQKAVGAGLITKRTCLSGKVILDIICWCL